MSKRATIGKGKPFLLVARLSSRSQCAGRPSQWIPWLTPGPLIRVPAASVLTSHRKVPLDASPNPAMAMYTYFPKPSSARRLSVPITRGAPRAGLVIDDRKGEDGASSVVST